MRRIITGHNADGKSVVMYEGPPARSIGEEVGGLYELSLIHISEPTRPY